MPNVLQGCLLSDWKQVLEDNIPEPADPETALPEHDCSTADSFKRAIKLFLKHTLNEQKPRDRQWIYMSPGGNFGARKDLLVSPLDHLHRFKEMIRISQMLPEGDTPNPNAALQVEWFYMSFHRSDCAEYLRSGRKLCDEMLATPTEYFKSGFDAGVANGMLCKLRDEQVCVKARNEYHHKLQACYHDMLKRLANSQRRAHSWRRDRDNINHGGKMREWANYRKHKPEARNNGNRKTPHEQAAKKPCHVHGPEAKHSYEECHTNPKNQRSANNNYSKRAHDAHYNDKREHESGNDSCQDTPQSPESSDGEMSASAAALPIKNYHLDTLHLPKKRRMGGVPHKSPGNKALLSSGSDTKRRMSLNFAMEDMFCNDVSMDLFIQTIGGQTDELGLDVHDGKTDFN
jgi:hypothetical protein